MLIDIIDISAKSVVPKLKELELIYLLSVSGLNGIKSTGNALHEFQAQIRNPKAGNPRLPVANARPDTSAT